MRKKIILPITKTEIASIRKYPQKTVDYPTYSSQKLGIILYSFILLLLIVMFIIGMFTKEFDWAFYLLLFLPLSYSHDFLNVFAVIDDGLISGSQYIVWNKIKAFHFVPIDINHKYYGFSKEANDGYELKIKVRGSTISCIITSVEMKEQLTRILEENVRI